MKTIPSAAAGKDGAVVGLPRIDKHCFETFSSTPVYQLHDLDSFEGGQTHEGQNFENGVIKWALYFHDLGSFEGGHVAV